jgi:hypothetical protein
VLGLGSDRMLELHARLLHITHRLRKGPDDIGNAALHSAAVRSKHPPKGVKLSVITDHGGRREFQAKSLVRSRAAEPGYPARPTRDTHFVTTRLS